MVKIMFCFWFDGNVQEVVSFYIIFLFDFCIDDIIYVLVDNFSMFVGVVFLVKFMLVGQQFFGFNGGLYFKFMEVIFFIIDCED